MAETKRRLPPWMLKQKTETKVLKSDANLISEDKRSQDQIKGKHVERKQRKRAWEERSEDQNEKPVKRKQRRKTSNQDSDELDEAELAFQRCQAKQRNGRTRRKDESKIGEGSTEDVRIKRAQKKMLVISDDETDLTVDDLVSIAEEYVNADRDDPQKSTVSGTTKNGRSEDSSEPMLDSKLSKGLLRCSKSKTNIDSSDYALSKKSNLKEDTNIPSDDKITGNPAQDMLDLFLGPLLNKPPPVKEPVIEPVEKVSNISLVVTNEKALHMEEENVKEREALVKKRSSLKDQVAMFLS